MRVSLNKRKRRYYLVGRVKKTFPVDVLNRTIDVPFPDFGSIPKPERYYIGQLIRMGFNVQHKLF